MDSNSFFKHNLEVEKRLISLEQKLESHAVSHLKESENLDQKLGMLQEAISSVENLQRDQNNRIEALQRLVHSLEIKFVEQEGCKYPNCESKQEVSKIEKKLSEIQESLLEYKFLRKYPVILYYMITLIVLFTIWMMAKN